MQGIKNTSPLSIFWFRRDLRLEDNHGLYQALTAGLPVLPIFIFDTNILTALENKKDARVQFIREQLHLINQQLSPYGSSLKTYIGKPYDCWKRILEEYAPKAVYSNKDYEPYATKRDKTIHDFLQLQDIPYYSFKDQVIFEEDEIVKADGAPYTIYTPYRTKWLSKFDELRPIRAYDCLHYAEQFASCQYDLPQLAEIGFEESPINFPPRHLEIDIDRYADTRDFPAFPKGTSHLGIHLRFGTQSVRQLVKSARRAKELTFLHELIWREFFMMCLWHFPHLVNQSYYTKYDHIRWENDEQQFEAWCTGNTGYPLVDAGMRELNATGFMHNRVRMLVASFLCKHLLIDWRWGEAYFAKKLLDYDQSANIGNWQWAAGCGMDAAPYFRVFNPTLQAKKFDPKFEYIKKWVPDFQDMNYPTPIVEHNWARQRAIERYKAGINQS